MLICTVILLLNILIISPVFAQFKTIQLIDKSTNQPIDNAFYLYDDNSGISNLKGELQISFEEGVSLFISHVSYGKIRLSSIEVKMALENGIFEVSEASNNLQPITFITVHPSVGEKNDLEIPVYDKLAHDAGQLLEQCSSISTIRKSGAYGFDPVLRGFKYDQINLVLDGTQCASAACPNRMDPASSQIPINMISKAEVLKGPYSLRFGNTFAGTINFKSVEPQFSETLQPKGRLGISYESNANIFRNEGVIGLNGQSLDMKLFGAYSQGTDYKDGDGIIIPANFNRLNWGGKLAVKLSKTQNMGVLISNNFAKDVDFPALPMDLRKDNTWLVNAQHSATFYTRALSAWNSTVYVTKVDHTMDNLDKDLNPRKVDAETFAKTVNYGGKTELRFDFKNAHLYSGLDFRSENADGERIRNLLMGPMAGKTVIDNVWQDAEVKRAGLFGELHLKNPEFHFVVSGRLDLNSAKSNNPDPNFAEMYSNMDSRYFNLSFSIGGTKVLNNSLSLGVWLGSAQRSPGIAERYINLFPIGLDPYEMLGNPELEPETNSQIDVILQHKTTKTNFNVNLFVSFLKDYISSEIQRDVTPRMSTSPGVRKFTNIGNAGISGFEMSWEQVVSRHINHRLSMVYTHGINKVIDEPLPEIPPFEIKYQLSGTFLRAKLLPAIQIRQVFKQERIASSYGETETPGFNVVDAKMAWLLNNNLTATGGINNIFDTAYYEHLSRSVRAASVRPIYSPGRSFYVTITFNFL